VPNYFSNEAGPVLGGAAESRRGELYSGQAAAAAVQPRTTQVAAVPAPAPAYRQHVAMAEPRGRMIRTRGAAPVAHHVTVHGRQVVRVSAQGSTRSHVAVSRTSHSGSARVVPVSRAAPVSSHHHARG
jgi:hypothetical protein